MKTHRFSKKDYPRLTEFYRLCRPDNLLTEADIRQQDRVLAGDTICRYLFLKEDALVASLALNKNDSAVDQFKMEILLHPGHEGLREGLYDYAFKKLKQHKPKSVLSRLRETWLKDIAFLQAKGFKELERQWESRLAVANFDETPFVWAIDKSKQAGVSYKTLADLPDTKKTQRLLYKTIVSLLKDVPFKEPLNIWPFELWLERYWFGPDRNPESVFLAFYQEELLGISELYKTGDPFKLKTGLTAVKRDFRRKGIAQSLKLQAVLYAKSKGVKEIATMNHSINRPMLAINEAMGFVKDPAWIRLKKVMA